MLEKVKEYRANYGYIWTCDQDDSYANEDHNNDDKIKKHINENIISITEFYFSVKVDACCSGSVSGMIQFLEQKS